jgi:carboxyl-terminal processing protease
MGRSIRYTLAAFVVVILLAGAFSGGLVVGWFLPGQSPLALLPGQNAPSLVQENNSGEEITPAELRTLFKPFWETWQIVNEKYVDQPVDQETLMRGAIRGMLESLGDEHTSYMDSEEYRRANLPMEGEYEGIGAWVDLSGDYMKIISPMPDSPAEKAGLLAGDQIIEVDGEDVSGLDGSLVLRRVLGKAGTAVTLTIQREGMEPFEVTIQRAKIQVPSVESEILEGNIAYVRLYTFGEKTNSELQQALKEVLADDPKGLIVDLRNNGGGFLSTAIDVVSQFIGEGVVMKEVYGDGKEVIFSAKPKGLATKIPLVILTNNGTASASEIVAGAVQDYSRGTLVGETTYGKGSVQNWISLKDDQGAVRVTIARWLTPKGRQINGVGLTPDVEVILTEENITNNQDPQLEKAIEILKGN